MTENTRKRSSSELGFIHKFIPASTRQDQVTLLLLHGTGGNEQDLIPLGRELYPRAAMLSPRGKVLESGMPNPFYWLSIVLSLSSLSGNFSEVTSCSCILSSALLSTSSWPSSVSSVSSKRLEDYFLSITNI